MLRRTQPITFDGDTQSAAKARAAEVAEEQAGIERRRHPRLRIEEPEPAPESNERRQVDRRHGERRQGDRRTGERRSIDSLRTGVNWTTAPEQRNGPFSILKRSGLKSSRILLLVLAIASGGLAAYVATGNEPPPAEPDIATVTEVIKEPRVKVLVATQTIGVGQRLSQTALGWEAWPEDSVREDYITQATAPDATTELNNAVARFELMAGDPIRSQKVMTDSTGYLSAVLESGQRGVSVPVSAEAASGGFISPNDRVDVLLTRNAGGAGVSETILNNVRVLAINSQLGESGPPPEGPGGENPQPAAFGSRAIATLALTPQEAEVIMGAVQMGRISLVLRSMTDFAEQRSVNQRATNQAIRLSSPFWSDDYQRAPQ